MRLWLSVLWLLLSASDDDGWTCRCGATVPADQTTCGRCGYSR